jgi:hypothetical protein
MPHDKTPFDLAAEMKRMADLHPHIMWSRIMAEGAAMITRLNDELQARNNG